MTRSRVIPARAWILGQALRGCARLAAPALRRLAAVLILFGALASTASAGAAMGRAACHPAPSPASVAAAPAARAAPSRPPPPEHDDRGVDDELCSSPGPALASTEAEVHPAARGGTPTRPAWPDGPHPAESAYEAPDRPPRLA
ncbi:hypothetical protein D3273_14565 [Lichenibacterium minor]|uniref:Uncharacterized protein n=1 Tax=Lichenibacterium minor TaxID=2316528 RepID=A0A4V1RUJ1_9HYPH|nr:hypothetical protein [Lichenibacterium minor]RYC31334.1 hypothetical protein D3273_14565 [Lichenibacterium minor]